MLEVSTIPAHIMIVDDEPTVATLATRILELRGFQISTCTDPWEGLEQLRASDGAYDVLISDICMPGLNGIELIRAVRAFDARIKVIAITGYSDRLTPEVVRRLRISRIVHKPFTVDGLTQTVEEVLASASGRF